MGGSQSSGCGLKPVQQQLCLLLLSLRQAKQSRPSPHRHPMLSSLPTLSRLSFLGFAAYGLQSLICSSRTLVASPRLPSAHCVDPLLDPFECESMSLCTVYS